MLSSADPDCALRTKGKHGRVSRVTKETLRLGGVAVGVVLGTTVGVAVGVAWVRSLYMHLTQCHSKCVSSSYIST